MAATSNQSHSPAPAPLPREVAEADRQVNAAAALLREAWPTAGEMHLVLPVDDPGFMLHMSVRDAAGEVLAEARQLWRLIEDLDPDTAGEDAAEAIGALIRAHVQLVRAGLDTVAGPGWSYLAEPVPAEEYGREAYRMAFILPTNPAPSLVAWLIERLSASA
jgi:hypothetical protein